ncbi:MAG: hypothetical protein OHK0031_01380 [Anaerolineales bacterium]
MPENFPLIGGILLFVYANLLLAALVLNRPERHHRILRFGTSLLTLILAALWWRGGFFLETFWLGALALAALLSLSPALNQRDWLRGLIQGGHFLLGLAVFLRPDWLTSTLGTPPIFPIQVALGGGFILSALAAALLGLIPAFSEESQTRPLAIPWLLWGLLGLLAGRFPQALAAGSAAFCLLWMDSIPWEKIILGQGADLGRRFIHLIEIGNAISLALALILLSTVEASLPGAQGSPQMARVREIALMSYGAVAAISILLIISVTLSINGMFAGLQNAKAPDAPKKDEERDLLTTLTNLLLQPFLASHEMLSQVARQQEAHARLLDERTISEKRRMAQLNLLHQINLELENTLDAPVSAQLTVTAIAASLGVSLAAVLVFEPEREEARVLASSGERAYALPPGYRQSMRAGLIGRALRSRRTQLVSDTRLDPDYLPLNNQPILSEIVVPLFSQNHLRGVLLVNHPKANAFDDSDMRTLEAIGVLLVTSWERSEHDQRLMRLIQSGFGLSTTLEIEQVLKQLAENAGQTLDARYVFLALVDKGGGFTRTASAGYAPTLSRMLGSDPEGNTLIQSVLNSSAPLRVRDVRKKFSTTPTGSADLRSMLAVPIRLRQASVGVLLCFGKLDNRSFNENDEALASLLASQAAAAIESTWLYQEIRSMFNTATQLYQLSTRVIQSEQLTDAAAVIAETCYQVGQASAAGIVLLDQNQKVEVKVRIDANGLHPGANHPLTLVRQALNSGQNIILAEDNEMARVCIPLQTPRRQYGALWLDVPEKNWNDPRFADNLHSLTNQAAIALERSILLSETRKQAQALESAYAELQVTYDQTLAALTSALDARDRETEGHSLRVARIASYLGSRIGLSAEQAKILERGAILHDIGKIGISDTILLKPGPLSPEEWKTMRLHPDIGARIIEGIPFLQETLPIIRYHQERWNGSGYPLGLKAHDIPLMARIFAVVDAYDALTTHRPYRTPISQEDALEFLRGQAGILFDPEIVEHFEALVRRGELKNLI